MPMRGQGLQASFLSRKRCTADCKRRASFWQLRARGDKKIPGILAAMEDLALLIDTGDRPPTTGAKPISAMQSDGLHVLNPIPGADAGQSAKDLLQYQQY